jgi:hypothetical protein
MAILKNVPKFFEPEKCVPELRQALTSAPVDLSNLVAVAVPLKDSNHPPDKLPSGMDRHDVMLTDGKIACAWQVESLQSLFRGTIQPPPLGNYPEAYEDSLLLLEFHALEISKVYGDRRDAEMEEVYSALRRRPDGKSLGFLHDYMWQAAALMLALRPLSEGEFEVIVNRLERSCRTFAMGPTSRNYIATLRATIGGA